MYGIPAEYDYINATTSREAPSSIHSQNTNLTRFFKRYLLQKAFGVFKWNLPKNWSKNYFLYTLYCYGYLAVINTDKFGVIPQSCGLQGYDVMYQPTNAIITNPLLTGIITPRIGTQCVLFKLQPDYGGILDLVSYYADMMSIAAETAGINLFNSKLSYVFSANNKSNAESFKKLYDDITSGKPAVVDKNLYNPDGTKAWDLFEQNVGSNYIAGTILEDLRKWEIMYLSEIGINNSNTNKKERMTIDEVNSNNEETKVLVDFWMEELQKSCAEVQEMFNVEIGVDWRYKKEVIPDES